MADVLSYEKLNLKKDISSFSGGKKIVRRDKMRGKKTEPMSNESKLSIVYLSRKREWKNEIYSTGIRGRQVSAAAEKGKLCCKFVRQ